MRARRAARRHLASPRRFDGISLVLVQGQLALALIGEGVLHPEDRSAPLVEQTVFDAIGDSATGLEERVEAEPRSGHWLPDLRRSSRWCAILSSRASTKLVVNDS